MAEHYYIFNVETFYQRPLENYQMWIKYQQLNTYELMEQKIVKKTLSLILLILKT